MSVGETISLLSQQKKVMRERMRSLRLVVDQKDGPDAAKAAMHHFLGRLDDVGLGAESVVAGYWPISTEIDPRPIIARLDDRGITCALPAIEHTGAPLVFRRWRPTDPLAAGPLETSHPLDSAPQVRPDVVLVPLLAVDSAGRRLGQGGGYFDRTLAALRENGSVTAVGIGFAIQVVDRVPHGDHDQHVDWVLTDRDFFRADR